MVSTYCPPVIFIKAQIIGRRDEEARYGNSFSLWAATGCPDINLNVWVSYIKGTHLRPQETYPCQNATIVQMGPVNT